MIALKKSNLEKRDIPNKSGLYCLYDSKGKPIYTGHSHKLRHRLQSYVQDDDYKAHPTKRSLREEAKAFSYRLMPVAEARRLEKQKKNGLKHNHL